MTIKEFFESITSTEGCFMLYCPNANEPHSLPHMRKYTSVKDLLASKYADREIAYADFFDGPDDDDFDIYLKPIEKNVVTEAGTNE